MNAKECLVILKNEPKNLWNGLKLDNLLTRSNIDGVRVQRKFEDGDSPLVSGNCNSIDPDRIWNIINSSNSRLGTVFIADLYSGAEHVKELELIKTRQIKKRD